MIRNLIKQVPLLLAFSVVIITLLAFQSVNSSDQREIAAAKVWFDTHIKPTAKVLPDWSDVEVRKNKGNTILDIAVNSRIQSFYMTEQRRTSGDNAQPNGSIRIIIKKDKNGNYEGGVLSVNGSSRYMVSHGQSGLKQIRLNPLNFFSKRFDGYAWLEDFAGVFKEGYYYENGIQKKQLGMSKSNRSNQLVQRDCSIYTYWVESYGIDSDGAFFVATYQVVVINCNRNNTMIDSGGGSSYGNDWVYSSGCNSCIEPNQEPVGCSCQTHYLSQWLLPIGNAFWTGNVYVNLSGITCDKSQCGFSNGFHTTNITGTYFDTPAQIFVNPHITQETVSLVRYTKKSNCSYDVTTVSNFKLSVVPISGDYFPQMETSFNDKRATWVFN